MKGRAAYLRHLIDFDNVTLEEWDELYALCSNIIDRPEDYVDALRGKVLATLFYEPSTRTSFSFQAAMLRLGGSVFGFSDPGSSSVAKGETLRDTMRICAGYADAIVIRSPAEGAAFAASLYSDVPIINAGDGGHLHPTQTMADLTVITRLRGAIKDINVGLCGDLVNGRTVHSLIKALSRFKGVRFYLISPRELTVPDYIKALLKESGHNFVEVTGLEATLPQLDILYMTRIQKERFIDPLEYERNKGIYVLTGSKLRNAKRDLLILHPLPRVDEISPDVDSDPRAVYFKQAQYGMYIRMALLYKLIKGGRLNENEPAPNTLKSCYNPRCITKHEEYLPALETQNGGLICCSYCDKTL